MNAWIQTVLNEAATIETERYDTKALNVSINRLQDLKEKNFQDSYRDIQSLLASSGVACVVLEPMENAPIDGVAKWITKERSVLGLRSREEGMWETLFEALESISLKQLKKLFITYSYTP